MKEKGKRGETPSNSFFRMNFLYQAAHLMSAHKNNSRLGNYYGKVLKEISNKMVEKLHPDIKRTMCSVCHSNLTSNSNALNVQLKPHPRKKKKEH